MSEHCISPEAARTEMSSPVVLECSAAGYADLNANEQTPLVTQCEGLPVEQITSYVLNELTTQEEEFVQTHLDACETCAFVVADILAASEPWVGKAGKQRLDALATSLWRFARDTEYRLAESVDQSKPKEITMHDHQHEPQPSGTARGGIFALLQKNLERKEKIRAAEWTSKTFELRDGDGACFDAGSSTFYAWEAYRDDLAHTSNKHITVETSNFMIFNDWATHPATNELQGQGTKVNLLMGTYFDRVHQAFYGESIVNRLRSGTFRPSLVCMGSGGIEFDGSSIWYAYHAGDPELAVKTGLLECRCENRVILTTARKIGRARGSVFNLLDKIDASAPLWLVTTAPKAGDSDAPYYKALEVFNSDEFQNALGSCHLEFHWIEVRDDGSAVDLATGIARAHH